MNIIIPCTGLGKRFLNYGYSTHKSLLPADNGELVIDKIFKMFDENDNFILITNENNYFHFEEICQSRKNTSIIHSVHESTGPIGSILKVQEQLSKIILPEPVIVVYSDFYQIYDYEKFKDFVGDSDGCILSYTGYHPHFDVSKNKYASSKLDEKNNVLEIREKHCDTEMKDGFHSSGMYYFKSFGLMNKYFQKLIENNDHINGEFYVSMAYNEMIRDGLRVTSYNDIDHFLQLGTPQDYEYFRAQEKKYRKLNEILYRDSNIIQVMLMAGRSERFISEGYEIPKPFMNVSNKKMHLLQSDFLNCSDRIFITADDYECYVEKNDHKYVFIEKNRMGPAYSYFKGAQGITGEVVITSCDVLANYFTQKFYSLKEESDVIIFSTKNHKNSNENPYMYSWIDHLNDKVLSVSLKKPLEHIPIENQSMLIGSFYMKDNVSFLNHLRSFLSINKPNNEEYFIDEFMNYLLMFGYRINMVEVDGYHSFGTPKEYLESNYWLSYFDKESKRNGF